MKPRFSKIGFFIFKKTRKKEYFVAKKLWNILGWNMENEGTEKGLSWMSTDGAGVVFNQRRPSLPNAKFDGKISPNGSENLIFFVITLQHHPSEIDEIVKKSRIYSFVLFAVHDCVLVGAHTHTHTQTQRDRKNGGKYNQSIENTR